MSSVDQKYGDLVRLKERLQEKCSQLSKKLGEASQQLKSVTTTLELLGYENENPSEIEAKYIYPPSQLKGLTQPQAVERIAKANNGRFKITDVIPLLIEAGVLKRSKNSYSIVFSMIQRTEKYERVGPGEYSLKTESIQRPLIVGNSR
jgi:hypothetical protein